MAKSGDVITNPITQERMVFMQTAHETNGALLQVEMFVKQRNILFVIGEHIHPNQEERLENLSGVMGTRVSGLELRLGPGEERVAPRGQRHTWWNDGEEELHVRLEYRPALRTEMFFETMYGLARDGKTNPLGIPPLLQVAVLGQEYRQDIRLAHPTLLAQSLGIAVLAPIGRLLGYRGWYPQYSTPV